MSDECNLLWFTVTRGRPFSKVGWRFGMMKWTPLTPVLLLLVSLNNEDDTLPPVRVDCSVANSKIRVRDILRL
jgi:hypothetical protein